MTTDEIERKIKEARMEKQWYAEEILEMAEDDDRGSDLWDEYHEKYWELCKQLTELRGVSDCAS